MADTAASSSAIGDTTTGDPLTHPAAIGSASGPTLMLSRDRCPRLTASGPVRLYAYRYKPHGRTHLAAGTLSTINPPWHQTELTRPITADAHRDEVLPIARHAGMRKEQLSRR